MQTGRACVDSEENMAGLQCCVPTGWQMAPIPDHSLPSKWETAFLNLQWNLERHEHMPLAK